MAALPKLSSRKISNKKRTNPVRKDTVTDKKKSVLHVSHLPSEYSEKELRAFFGQFGKILKLRLSRSKKTARSRGYGYIQYEMPEIARLAAEATNNYFIGGKPILVEVINHEAVLPGLFRGANKKFKDFTLSRESVNRKGHNKKSHASFDSSKLEEDQVRSNRLADAGIEYDFTRKLVKKVMA
jgi:nucleolar protein 15